MPIDVPSPLAGEGISADGHSLIRVRGISFPLPVLRQTPHPPSMPGIEGTLSRRGRGLQPSQPHHISFVGAL